MLFIAKNNSYIFIANNFNYESINMSDHFKGTGHVELQPDDLNYQVRFKFNAASASTNNNGAIPYGSTIKTIATTIKDDKNIDATSEILASSELGTSNLASIFLNYSTNIANGRYTITSKVTFSLSGSTEILTKEFDFRRLYLRNE